MELLSKSFLHTALVERQ
uniref:Uncharacterized protein n=1 Tax=Arundo donax TaxID=35708 RepID=A0A0A9GTR6_ARUDO